MITDSRLRKCAMRAGLAAALTWVAAADAADYPARPVAIIMPAPAGSGPDVIARITGASLARSLGQQIVILNRPGAGGLNGVDAAAHIRPDGYTLYMPLSSTFVVLPVSHPKEMQLDLKRDLVPIGLVGEQPMVIAVNPGLGVKTMAQLVQLAKHRSGRIFYGSNAGSLPSLTAALLQRHTGMKLTFVPYASTAKATQDTVSGVLQLVVESASGLAGPIRSGELIPLAVAADRRLAEFPDLPTVEEALPGIGHFAARGWFALMAHAGTPETIVEKLRVQLQRTLGQPEVQRKFAALGTYVRPMSPADLAVFIDKEQTLWRPVVEHVFIAGH